MEVFLPTLNQMGLLILLMLIGYLLVKFKIMPEQSAVILSKLENTVLLPALVLSTFMENMTVQRLSGAWQYFVCGLVAVSVSVPVALGIVRLITKDAYIRKIYTYGLAFSNFGFMGNAVVVALFPAVFPDYLIYVMPFYMVVYTWGVPELLLPKREGGGLKSRLLAFQNPMVIAMLLGIVLGLTRLPLPQFVGQTVSVLGSGMSPVAMLLTGMTIANIDLIATLKNWSIYVISLVRLILIPLVGIALVRLIGLPYPLALCTVCVLAMPLGLSTVVIPGGYGLDTSVAAGMALISHVMSAATIPLVFMLFHYIVA